MLSCWHAQTSTTPVEGGTGENASGDYCLFTTKGQMKRPHATVASPPLLLGMQCNAWSRAAAVTSHRSSTTQHSAAHPLTSLPAEVRGRADEVARPCWRLLSCSGALSSVSVKIQPTMNTLTYHCCRPRTHGLTGCDQTRVGPGRAARPGPPRVREPGPWQA